MLVDFIIQGSIPDELKESMTLRLTVAPLIGERICVRSFVFHVVDRWHDADLNDDLNSHSTLVCTLRLIGRRPTDN